MKNVFRVRLRDAFWLLFIIALACLWWREHARTERLEREAKFYYSAAPPIFLTNERLDKAIATLEANHGMKIDVDWPSITQATGLGPSDRVTHQLVDGSLSWAIERMFIGCAVIEGTDHGILIRGRDPERDGPIRPDRDARLKNKSRDKQQP